VSEVFSLKSIQKAFTFAFIMAAVFVCSLSGQVGTARIEHMLLMRDNTLYVMEATGANRLRVATEVSTAAFSPDGNLVAYADRHGIKVFDLQSAKTSTLAKAPAGLVQNVAWSPTQHAVAFSQIIPNKEEVLYLSAYPSSGVPPRQLGPTYGGISFSSDGNFILHGRAVENGGTLERTNLESGKTETLYAAKTLIEEVSYAPDDSQIAFLLTDEEPESSDSSGPSCVPSGLSLWILASNSKSPAKVSLKQLGDPDINHFSWSPKGNLLVFDSGRQQCDFPGDHGDIFVISPDLRTAYNLSKRPLSIRPFFSPDGQRVLFADFSTYDNNHGPNLMIGDLRTRAVKPFPGQLRAGDNAGNYDQIMDWK
jgi:Tol biopolymer transport system component